MAKNQKTKSAKSDNKSDSKTTIQNLGGKRVLVYPLGAIATIGDETRIANASPNATQFVTIDGTTPNGKRLIVTDSNGKQFDVSFSNIGSLGERDESGKLVEITVKAWQLISQKFFATPAKSA